MRWFFLPTLFVFACLLLACSEDVEKIRAQRFERMFETSEYYATRSFHYAWQLNKTFHVPEENDELPLLHQKTHILKHYLKNCPEQDLEKAQKRIKEYLDWLRSWKLEHWRIDDIKLTSLQPLERKRALCQINHLALYATKRMVIAFCGISVPSRNPFLFALNNDSIAMGVHYRTALCLHQYVDGDYSVDSVWVNNQYQKWQRFGYQIKVPITAKSHSQKIAFKVHYSNPIHRIDTVLNFTENIIIQPQKK